MTRLKYISFIILCLFALRTHADSFEVVDHKFTMPIDTPWIRVLTNYQEWLGFYFDLLAAQGISLDNWCAPESAVPVECSPPMPPVDFDHYQIIVGGLGIRYQGASKIVISGVDSVSDDKLNIHVMDINPSEECLTTTVINHPMVAVAVGRSERPLNVTVDEAVLSCRQSRQET